jgi:hypothetical protein
MACPAGDAFGYAVIESARRAMNLWHTTTEGRRARPFNALAALGSAAHNRFERWAGVGVFLEPELGRRNTNILWSVFLPHWFWRALVGTRRDEPRLAFNAGLATAGALVHYVDWPWELKFGVLPWLTEAEGFRPSLLKVYNSILWLWFVGGVGSLVAETRRENRKYFAAGLATAPLLLLSARHHYAWAKRQAEQGSPYFTKDLLNASAPRAARPAEPAQ